jgi:hypothetical protein
MIGYSPRLPLVGPRGGERVEARDGREQVEARDGREQVEARDGREQVEARDRRERALESAETKVKTFL